MTKIFSIAIICSLFLLNGCLCKSSSLAINNGLPLQNICVPIYKNELLSFKNFSNGKMLNVKDLSKIFSHSEVDLLLNAKSIEEISNYFLLSNRYQVLMLKKSALIFDKDESELYFLKLGEINKIREVDDIFVRTDGINETSTQYWLNGEIICKNDSITCTIIVDKDSDGHYEVVQFLVVAESLVGDCYDIEIMQVKFNIIIECRRFYLAEILFLTSNRYVFAPSFVYATALSLDGDTWNVNYFYLE